MLILNISWTKQELLTSENEQEFLVNKTNAVWSISTECENSFVIGYGSVQSVVSIVVEEEL
jgi:hypothetical protein